MSSPSNLFWFSLLARTLRRPRCRPSQHICAKYLENWWRHHGKWQASDTRHQVAYRDMHFVTSCCLPLFIYLFVLPTVITLFVFYVYYFVFTRCLFGLSLYFPGRVVALDNVELSRETQAEHSHQTLSSDTLTQTLTATHSCLPYRGLTLSHTVAEASCVGWSSVCHQRLYFDAR
jgi:hypothetical protein